MQHSPKTTQIHSRTWSYYDIGKGKQTIVLFPDIMGTYESWFEYMHLLSQTHHVIIPFYPPISNLDDMIESLHMFIAHCKVPSYSLIGTSLGGLFAQMYVRKYPHEVNKLLLIATGTADKVFGVIAAVLFLGGHIIPEIGMKWFVYITAFLSLNVSKEQKRFWMTYLKSQIWQVNTKPFMLAWGKCVLALCWRYKFSSSDLKTWNKPIYLIESNNDLVFNPLTRHHLRSIYPQATCYTLRGGNHLLWINRSSQVSEILQKFIP